jgi:hypothetical protein
VKIEVWEETSSQIIRNSNLNYFHQVRKALDGDAESIKNFIELSKYTDTAGMYGHGATVLEVAFAVGDKKFVEAVKGLSDSEKETTKALLAMGKDFGEKKRTDADIRRELPLTLERINWGK